MTGASDLVERRLVATALRLEVVELGERGIRVAERRVPRRGPVRRGHEEEPDHLRPEVADLPQLVADEVREVEEHAAAGSAGKTGDDVGARAVRSQTQAGRLVGLGQGVVGQEGLDLLADPLGDQAVVVEEGQPAERADPVRGTRRAGKAIEAPRRHPLIDRRERSRWR